jgi:hypothetical protein
MEETECLDVPAYRLVRGLSSLEIEVLGAGRVLVAGTAATFTSTQAFLVLAALALAPRGTLHWEVLVNRLWPDASAERGRASLRAALWEARRALGPEGWRVQRKGDLLVLDLAASPSISSMASGPPRRRCERPTRRPTRSSRSPDAGGCTGPTSARSSVASATSACSTSRMAAGLAMDPGELVAGLQAP